MNDTAELTLRLMGTAVVLSGALWLTIVGEFGRVWRSEERIRNPYARTGRGAIALFWLAAASLAWCLTIGNFAGAFMVFGIAGLYGGLLGVISGLAYVVSWLDDRPQPVRRAASWTAALLVAWLLVLGLSADAKADAPIIKLRNVVAPWHWKDL